MGREEQERLERERMEQEAQSRNIYDLPPEEDDNENKAGGISAIALYDYQANAEDEISFDPNDVITNIEMIEDGWFIGESYGRRGLFPSNYVEIIHQKEEKKVKETKNVEEVSEVSDDGLSAVALYDYQATEEGELSFDPEDIITNIEKMDEDGGLELV